MGGICSDVTHESDAPQHKIFLLNQNQFQLNQQFNRNNPELKQRIPDLYQRPVYKHINDDKYFIGEWQQSKASGQGVMYIPNNLIYDGQFVAGKPNGKGKMTFLVKQEQYEGNFENGKAHGYGQYKNNKKKFTFQGQWNKSNPNKGNLIFQDNQTISKIQIQDFALRKAAIAYKDGRIYSGQIDIKKFIPEGNGTLTFQDGSIYSGEWKNGLMHGKGHYEWKDGSKYIGDYLNGKKQGQGIFYYTSGKKYQGHWVNGKQQGNGKIITKNQQIQKQGIWKDGKLIRPIQNINQKLQQNQIENTQQVN